MPRKNSNARSNGQNGQFKEADAFLRLVVTDKNGNEHRIEKDLPLYLDKHVMAQLIKNAELDADKEFTLKGNVHIIDRTPKDDIAF